MVKKRLIALAIFLLGVWTAISVYQSQVNGTRPFHLGLDLSGGSYLVYDADTDTLDEKDIPEAMDSLRDVIERRINAFGVAEPIIHTETSTVGTEDGKEVNRLIVELPGITDIDEAVEMIGQTPLLEFKVEASPEKAQEIQEKLAALSNTITVGEDGEVSLTPEQQQEIIDLQNQLYENTPLTGAYLKKAQLQFNQPGVQNGGSLQAEPVVALTFNDEGAKLFEEITGDNIGKTVAIYLDGAPISTPRVNAKIPGGQAIIEGNFDLDEAKTLVGRLNSGALPIPITLVSTNTIGPTLGHDAVNAGMKAGVIGFALVALLLIFWYRLPGLIAVVALGLYTSIMLWLFQFIPVTLTSAGIAGFVISIGMAVDANILIFERMKEEIQKGSSIYDAINTGFKRAWPSIRDANISSIISAVILFATNIVIVKGFAITFGLGIIISMLTAITFTRLMLLSLNRKDSDSPLEKFLYGSGFSSPSSNNE